MAKSLTGRFKIPDDPNPQKLICLSMMIPDDELWIANITAAIGLLTLARSYQNSSVTPAREIAQVWRNLFETLVIGDCPVADNTSVGYVEDDMPFFREVCENDKCYLEYQCCPGEWVRLANADQLTLPTSLGEHQEQPAPGGGTAKYCVNMLATGKTPLPTTVNTGDVITLNSASGNANDGTETNFRCPDGNIYYGGACSPGTGYLQAGDPIAHNHMSVVFSISGTFYAFISGTFTVPAGISNGQVLLQVNDANLSDNSGSYDVCVTVTNNQATTWTHEFFVDTNASGWIVITPSAPCAIPFGQWSPGSGFESTLAQCTGPDNAYRTIAIRRLFSHRIITSLSVTNVFVAGSVVAGQTSDLEGKLAGTLKFDQSIAAGIAPGSPWAWMGSQDCDELVVSFVAGYCSGICDPGGNATITKITVSGIGTDPF